MTTRNLSSQKAAATQYTVAQILHANEQAVRLGHPLLTETGLAHFRESTSTPAKNGKKSHRHKGASTTDPVLPSWDGRRLWFGAVLLREYKQPASQQTALLDAFERQGWAIRRIKDVLYLFDEGSEEEAKRRLHNTIKNLKRELPPGTIRFRGDGTGKGVIWEPV